MLVSCNNNKPGVNSPESSSVISTVDPQVGAENFKGRYLYTDPSGCSTGEKDYSSREQLCTLLVDHNANQNCAADMRQKRFEDDCSGREWIFPNQSSLEEPQPLDPKERLFHVSSPRDLSPFKYFVGNYAVVQPKASFAILRIEDDGFRIGFYSKSGDGTSMILDHESFPLNYRTGLWSEAKARFWGTPGTSASWSRVSLLVRVSGESMEQEQHAYRIVKINDTQFEFTSISEQKNARGKKIKYNTVVKLKKLN